jgi:hypothetical protein
MAAKLKIGKKGDEILIVHCCFSISQNELKLMLTDGRLTMNDGRQTMDDGRIVMAIAHVA